MRFGMMQGRLVPSKDGRLQSFPTERWRDEFELAIPARIDCLEWLYDDHDAALNPLSTPEGRTAIRAAVEASGVPVASVCAHWFVEHPLLGAEGAEADAALAKLRWLGEAALAVGAGRIVLPMEAAETCPDHLEASLVWVERLARLAGRDMPVLALELSCGMRELEQVVTALRGTELKVNYDLGNSAGRGLDVTEELDLIGSRLGSVHLKDKPTGGASVPLGQGNADFRALGRWLQGHGYRGDLVLEAARGPLGQELPWTLDYRDFLDAALGAG